MDVSFSIKKPEFYVRSSKKATHDDDDKAFFLGIICMWLLLWVVGLTSTYFHATLSLLGQLLDEISVLWVLMAGMAFWFPEPLIPQLIKSSTDRSGRKRFVFVVSRKNLDLKF